MNVTVSVTTGTRINVTSSGQRNVTISDPSSLTLAQVDTLYYPRSNPSGFATGVDNSTLVLRAETGQFYPRSNPSGFITGGQTSNITNVVFTTGNQIISGQKTFVDIAHFNVLLASGNSNKIDLANGIILDTQDTFSIDWDSRVLWDNNPNLSVDWQNRILSGVWTVDSLRVSGVSIGGNTISNIVFTTGDQTISGVKTFADSPTNVQSIVSPNWSISAGGDGGFQTIGINHEFSSDGGEFLSDGAGHITANSFSADNFNISGSPLGSFFKLASQTLDFVSGLTSGLDHQFIGFPRSMTGVTTVVCDFVNDVDNFIYSHGISSVSSSGFIVSFSDILTNTGYKLHVKVAI